MKKSALLILLMLATVSWAAQKQDEYPIIVHVSSSQYDSYNDSRYQVLTVIIDGKNYTLAGATGDGLLSLGDYKAKLLKDVHKNSYESAREYEFLYPDNKTRKFSVIGQSE